MTGGCIYIPIRGVNDEKISLSSTKTNLKAGTYAKIKRGIDLQKQVILIDLVDNTKPMTSVSLTLLNNRVVDNIEVSGFTFGYVNSSGTTASGAIIIYSDDSAIATTLV